MKRRYRRIWFVGLLTFTALVASACESVAPQSSESGSSKTEAGDEASWELLNPSEITAQTTKLKIGVTRIDCANGVTGQVLEPQLQFESTRIVIRAVVEKQNPGSYDCPSNNVVPVTIDLPNPVGNRELFDAACLDSRMQNTTMCADVNGIRWKP